MPALPGIAEQPVAIIGMACRLPAAGDLVQFWRLIVEGRSAIGELPPDRFNQELYYDPQQGIPAKSYTKIGAVLESREFDRQACPLPEELVVGADPTHLLMCETAAAACRHAGLDPFALPLKNTGVYVGHAQGSTLAGDYIYCTCVGEAAELLGEIPQLARLSAGDREALIAELTARIRSELPERTADSPDVATHMVAGLVSKAFGLSGPFLAVNAACASSPQALLLAVRALQLGRIDMAIVGGASDCKSDTLTLFSAAQSMSASGSRPFDADADGLVCSEGYVAVVLKTLARAVADGDPVQAVIRGLGLSSDGHGKSLWAPRKEGQIAAVERAYRGGLDPATLQYIEAHATSTSLGDATELTALAEVLAGRVPPDHRIALGSIKANLGHTLECAGLTSVVKTVLCLQRATIPPAINIRELNKKIDWERAPFYVPQAAAPWPAPAASQPRRAAVNSFGIGGLNVHIVLEEFFENGKVHCAALMHPTRSDDEAVAVIGMGCILPGAVGARSLGELLASGRDPKTHAPADRWPADKLQAAKEQGLTTLGGFVTDFAYDWRRHKVPPKQVAGADPMQFMLLEAADQALKHAGYDGRPLDRQRTGVLVGTEFGGDFSTQLQLGLRLPHMQHVLTGLLQDLGLSTDQIERANESFARALLNKWPALTDETGSFSTSTLASRITKTFDLMGGAAAIDSGDTSALTVLAGAVDLLLAGDCDVMFCAAGQRRMGWPTYEALSLAGVLTSGERPAAPFDVAARGLVPGEGVGVVLLKRLADARRDGDRVHAIIRGIGAARADTCEAALELAMSRSLEIAGTSPQDVAVLEADGLGLPDHDQQIVRVARHIFGQSPRTEPLLLGTAVGQLGHTVAASGMVSLLKAACEVESGIVPPVVGLSSPLDGLSAAAGVVAPVGQPQPMRLTTSDRRRLAGVASQGKGLAFHVVLERGEPVPAEQADGVGSLFQKTTFDDGNISPEKDSRPLPGRVAAGAPASVLFAASHENMNFSPWPERESARASVRQAGRGRICRMGAGCLDQLQTRIAELRQAPATLLPAGDKSFDPADTFRLAIVAPSSEALAQKLELAERQLANPAARLVLEQQGIFFRQRHERPRIAFVFPGQGSQYAGMLRELVASSPAAHAAMRQLDAAMQACGEPTFAQLAWQQGDQLGSDVWRTQIAMLLADMITLAALRERGIQPDVLTGHSFGEFAALTAGQAWSLEAAMRIVKARAAGVESVRARGLLLATSAPREKVGALAAFVVGPIHVANHNAPDQTVVGGSEEALAQLADVLAAHDYKAQLLPVPAPFHTPLMEGSAGLLEAELRAASLRPPRVPLLSSVTNRYVADPEEIRVNLAHQLTQPVEWVALVRRLADEGPLVLVEVGPQQALTKLARRILQDREMVGIVACDNPSRPGPEQLDCVQALLECAGALDAQPAAAAAMHGAPVALPSPLAHRGRVVHFDATEVRREKMRQTAARVDVPAPEEGPAPAAELPSPKAPAAAAPPRTAPAIDLAQLESFLVNFVVEQTGYPPDVVDLDADLEADLGIDSIKKAQMLGELQEYLPDQVQPSADVTLDDFPTLRHVLNFLRGDGSAEESPAGTASARAVMQPQPELRAPLTATNEGVAEGAWMATPVGRDSLSDPQPPAAPARSSIDTAQLESFLVNFVVEQTGYPPEVVDLDADLEADLGIDSIKKAQMLGELQEYFPDQVQPSADVTLDDFPTLRHVVNYLRGGPELKETTAEPAPHTYRDGDLAAEADSAASPLVLRLAGSRYEMGLAHGRQLREEIRRALRYYADLAEGEIGERPAAAGDDPAGRFTSDELEELRGIAAGAGVAVGNIVAHNAAWGSNGGVAAAPQLVDGWREQLVSVVQVRQPAGAAAQTLHSFAGLIFGSANGFPAPGRGLEFAQEEPPGHSADAPALKKNDTEPPVPLVTGEETCRRYVMRMVRWPLPSATPRHPAWAGPVVILGNNSLARALAAEIGSSGGRVHFLPSDVPLDQTLAALDEIWRSGPAPHLFLLSGNNSEPLEGQDEVAWQRRRVRTIETPFFVCQRWVQLAREEKVLDCCTLVATTSLGGDFGFSGQSPSTEGGWLTGLIKSLFIEIVRVGNHRDFLVKAIDAPPDEPPALLAASICRELAGRTDDFEVGFIGGRRFLQNAYLCEATPFAPASIRPGAVWLVTGGARGITAACALELGKRFGLRLHLIGTSPPPQIEPGWLEMSAAELAQLKTTVMREAYERGQSPPEAFSRVEKAIEIACSLRALADAGLAASYHSCDVADRAALARVLDDVRQQDGPIEGILHGAGIDIPRRFEKKERASVMATFAAKVEGAANLMALTRDDPLRHFIGFGSVSGRLGSNGQTDYAAASDMLCKLISWYGHQRPECRAVAFHWAPWDEVGMAARPENRMALKVKDAPQLMPKEEGVQHLVRELYDAAATSEVLIIDPAYHRLFYNKSQPPTVGDENAPDIALAEPTTVVTPDASRPDRVTERFVLRLFETPAPPAADVLPEASGAIYILGDNEVARSLGQRITARGHTVVQIPVAESPETTLEKLEAAWRQQPGNYLLLTTACEEEAAHIFEPRQWSNRMARGVLTPYLVLQRWRQLWLDWSQRQRATVAAITRLGGDFGLGGNCVAPEGGALAGMLKSLFIEDLRSESHEIRVRVIDTRTDERPDDVAAWVVQELATDSREIEVTWQSGRRFVLRPVAEAAPLAGAELPRGGTWIVTGGGCGISAATALELGRRYGLKLHLIGRSPSPQANAAWRGKPPAELELLKAEIVRRASGNGESPQRAWERIRRDIEIYDNLQRFAAAGVKATYHSCDVGDLPALASVLDEVRRQDGPITGILHGAGTNQPARLERQRRDVVEEMIGAKVAGAWNLMFLTRQDPVRHFIGFGSVTGRFGGNGMTDYAATNEMLARLIGWYRRERPDCAAVCCDWESWGEVGMAVAPRHVMAGVQAKLQFMPPCEGIEHLICELAAGAPEAEVVFTREQFIAERYPHVQPAKLAEISPTGLPLISRIETSAAGTVAEAILDPVVDPFLREHRLRGKPLLPAVVGLELLAEAAQAAAGGDPEVVALRDIEIVDGLAFSTNQSQTPRVTVEGRDGREFTARLTCDFFNRSGKLIQARRPYLQGIVELAAARPPQTTTCPPPPPDKWHAFHYEDAHLIYHGHVLRGVQQTTFNQTEGWARLVALPLQGLAGRRPAAKWIIPSTLLDAAFYACGIHVWYYAAQTVSLPHGVRELRLGRRMRDHEQCLVHFVCRQLATQSAEYDFTIFGEDGEAIAQVVGYRKVLLSQPGGRT